MNSANRPIKLGVVMDPIQTIHYKKDTTLAFLWAARRLGWELTYFEQSDLYLENQRAFGRGQRLEVFENPHHWFEFTSPPESMALSNLDVILMRKDPPFDMEFIYSTYILEAAQREGVLVVNNPASLRDCNEKLFATQFPQCCPTLRVSRSMDLLREFHAEHGDVIFKPLDGMGGSAIFRVKRDDPNLSVILEQLTQFGTRQIMAQVYLPQIAAGDKRILMIQGEPVSHCLARIPKSGESRGNLAAGGTGRVQSLSDRDRWIAEEIGPTLKENGLLFVGLDVIGDYLTEINVTSPTCVREIDAVAGTQIGDHLMQVILEKICDGERTAL